MLRRTFLRNTVIGAAGALALTQRLRAATDGVTDYLAKTAGASVSERAADERLWLEVSRLFNPANDFVNLEYGYFSPAALRTLDSELENARMLNTRAAYYLRRDSDAGIERVRGELAELGGVSPKEVCLTRNTTESMNIIINGLDLAPGDEIIYADQDYNSMIQALNMKAARYGVVLKKVAVPLHPSSDEEIVTLYEKAITPRTKLLHLTHLFNLSGQVTPVAKIAAMGRRQGIESAVDAAHTFAQLNYAIEDLGCDYMAASLHKWLCAPVGLGLLYVKKEKIPKVWPLMGDMAVPRDDIRKLEHLGTRPDYQILALSEAIRFHRSLGSELKEARLRYLSRHWMNRFRNHERVVLNTPTDPARHGALGNVGIKAVDAKKLAAFFLDRHGIFTVEKSLPPLFTGVRVTPGIPTPLEHIDRFIAAVDDALTQFKS